MHTFSFDNLRNAARVRRAGAMRQFPTGQVYSMLKVYGMLMNERSMLCGMLMDARSMDERGMVHTH
jgi:hypothetical protein